MSGENSILDKVISSKQAADISEINLKTILEELKTCLKSQERDIVNRRFGLEGNAKEPLEQIGKSYSLTRERIRQIESSAIKKIKQSKKSEEVLAPLEKTINRLLEEHGGAMEQEFLFSEFFDSDENTKENQQVLIFILEKISKKFVKLAASTDFLSGWAQKITDLEQVKNYINQLVDFITTKNQHFQFEALHREISQQTENALSRLSKETLESYLHLAIKLGANPFGDFGLKQWGFIQPKRMRDKIHLILKKQKKPLHFTKISDLINKANFDHKKALPQTVHNELIIDKKFVLVGRGIYALKEWGYEPGIVSDIITRALKEADKPLSKEEIFTAVLKQRLVKKMTIYISLIDRSKFKKLSNGRYTLIVSDDQKITEEKLVKTETGDDSEGTNKRINE